MKKRRLRAWEAAPTPWQDRQREQAPSGGAMRWAQKPVDWWLLEGECYEGASIVNDCAQLAPAGRLAAIGCYCAFRLIAQVTHGELRGEDIWIEREQAFAYLSWSPPTDGASAALSRALHALDPTLTERVANALCDAARAFTATSCHGSARSCADLAYEVALALADARAAEQASRVLARLATLDECPHSARLWQRRAAVHARRAARAEVRWLRSTSASKL